VREHGAEEARTDNKIIVHGFSPFYL
jgi:hypothetical protein